MSQVKKRKYPFPKKSPEDRWYAFGRYYAMFPPDFPYDAVKGLTNPGDVVLDPFCGRGNSLFCAMAQDRGAVGIDENPLAYLYSAARCSLVTSESVVLDRLYEVGSSVLPADRKSRNCFDTMAWSPDVRGFFRAARRELDWRNDSVDRILMGFVALHAQDKSSPSALSNRLPPTIACSPTYAVRWWTEKSLTKPPSLNPVKVLAKKIKRRFEFGVPELKNGQAYEGDARDLFADISRLNASLLITSPPYRDVTDYWNDHWIRLWLLGYPFRKDWSRAAKFAGEGEYRQLLVDVLTNAKPHLADSASVLVRSDIRRRTSEICQEVLNQVFPGYQMYIRQSEAAGAGESVHHGRGGTRAKEVDFLLANSDRAKGWAKEHGFELKKECKTDGSFSLYEKELAATACSAA